MASRGLKRGGHTSESCPSLPSTALLRRANSFRGRCPSLSFLLSPQFQKVFEAPETLVAVPCPERLPAHRHVHLAPRLPPAKSFPSHVNA